MNKRTAQILFTTFLLLIWRYLFNFFQHRITLFLFAIHISGNLTPIKMTIMEFMFFLLPALVLIRFYKIDLKNDFFLPDKKTILYSVFISILFWGIIVLIQYAMRITEPTLLSYLNSIAHLLSFKRNNPLLVIFGYAIVPAISEELFFRGFYLNFLDKNMGINAIILSAALFAVFHFEILFFLQIFIAGILLGYLYKFSKSLIIPMFFHFLINLATIFSLNMS